MGNPDGPTLTTWELTDGLYVDPRHVSGDEPLDITAPYPLTLVPARLLD